MVGYDIGGATALQVCGKSKSFTHCVLLDPWVKPIDSQISGKNAHKITQPICCVNSEEFHPR